MKEDPYAPPSCRLDVPEGPSLTPGSSAFPALLLLRWALALWAVAVGLSETYFYLSNWTALSEKAFIDASYQPLPSAVLAVMHVVGGLILFVRSKWSTLVFLLHFMGYVAKFLMFAGWDSPPPVLIFYLSLDAITIWLCLHLWAHSQFK